ncbi:MAG: hypothetical protein PHC88_02990 [Terrimicrobiaceae bacterium]|nr:hypothetical protein [Terrimicrobiaceae bacterium]
MIYALSLIALVSSAATIALAVRLAKLRRSTERSLRELEKMWSGKLQQIEPSLAGKANADEVRNLAAMVDGVAAVGLRLDLRLSALEAGKRAEESRDS